MAPEVPAEVLELLQLGATNLTWLPGRTAVWRVEHPKGVLTLKQHDPQRHPPTPATVEDDIGWVHRLLGRIPPSAVLLPRPAPVMDGRSVAIAAGAVWETVTFVDGREVGWARRPTMFELGSFLAELHDVIAEVQPDGQRHPCVSVRSLTEPATWAPIRLTDRDRGTLDAAVGALGAELDALEHDGAPTSAIHGDLTNHNVIASPARRPVGVIDFGNAYVEATLADLGYALWRSGRPSQEADGFDAGRIAAYLAGYHTRRALTDRDRRAVVTYLRARGLQMLARQAQQRPDAPEPGPLRRLAWLAGHGDALLRGVLAG